MAKGGSDRAKKTELDPTLPHLHKGFSNCADAEQRRVGLHLFEVAADGDRLGDHRAVVELERRRALHGIERRELRRLVLHLVDVDRHARNRDALFGQKDAHPPRVWGAGLLVEFHGAAPDPRTRSLSTPQVKRILTFATLSVPTIRRAGALSAQGAQDSVLSCELAVGAVTSGNRVL